MSDKLAEFLADMTVLVVLSGMLAWMWQMLINPSSRALPGHRNPPPPPETECMKNRRREDLFRTGK